MISVVVCTHRPIEILKLEDSIRNTIGLPFELIALKDFDYQFSIFCAYNAGVSLARFETLCFVHDDVIFETKQWGKVLLEHLNDTKTGFIGVAGGSLMGRIPAPWSYYLKHMHLKQSDNKGKKTELLSLGSFNSKHACPVAVLDGVFIACRKELFDTISFDENTYNGFHCYDQDICTQAHLAGYQNRVVNNVLLTHYSKGCLDRIWIECQLNYWRKWMLQLPLFVGDFDIATLGKREKHYLEHSFTRKMIRYGFTIKEIQGVYTEYNRLIQANREQKAKLRYGVLLWQKLSLLFKQ